MNNLNRTKTMPPPYEDRDCHRPLEDYTKGFMVRTREVGQQSTWRATFTDEASALREVRECIDARRYIEVSFWQDGTPREVWKLGRPLMGSGVAA